VAADLCRYGKKQCFFFRKGEEMVRTRKGITLIELLIVVLILAALSAIAIPRISQSANNAKARACDVNCEVMNSAIELFNADTGAYPLVLTDVTGSVDYFPDAAPVCGFATAYVLNADNRVVKHGH
jgi:prepilin-type N-terminal cleavage/methylation domain-containing protein